PPYSFGPCCDYSLEGENLWSSATDGPPRYRAELEPDRTDPSAVLTVEKQLDDLSSQLRTISLDIHSHPELAFEEKYAHDLLTKVMEDNGFAVTRGPYVGLSTAWRAEFSVGQGGPVIGVNSEMDALRGIGHACGHNLIAVNGIGVAIALKAAMQEHQIPGKIVLLGTPAEEGGGGKAIMLERGAYAGMDICLMSHPRDGPPPSVFMGSMIAVQMFEVDYHGHSAHAGAYPWEGTNALDAAFVAYSAISALRQQLKPDFRVHGVVEGQDWSQNVIPDNAKMKFAVRAPSLAELKDLSERVQNCFRAGALATSCTIEMKFTVPYYDLRQNSALSQQFTDAVSKYGVKNYPSGATASTDFGNVSYVVPSLHPGFAITTTPNGGNHTPAFATAAETMEAHNAMILTAKGLALTGLRALTDSAFLAEVTLRFTFAQFETTLNPPQVKRAFEAEVPRR
ncbi:hypothetical protein BKA70DRAFT_1092893, partial [Coprinopsis sp. MPI-PUGE-AT-0042]